MRAPFGLLALLAIPVLAPGQAPTLPMLDVWSSSLREVAPLRNGVDRLLIEGLRSPSLEARRKTALAIGAKDFAMSIRWSRREETEEHTRGRQALIEALAEVAKDPDPALYRHAVRSMATLVRNRAWGHHGEPWSDPQEVATLVALGPKAMPILTDMLLDPDVDYAVKVALSRVVKQTRDPQAIPALIELASQSDHFLLSEALDTLALFDDPRVIPALVANIDKNILSYEDTPGIWALKKVGKKAVPALVAAIDGHPREGGRYYATHALVHIIDPIAIPGLLRALENPKAEIRGQAVSALSVQDPAKVPSKPIRYCLLDPNAQVRAVACTAIGAIGDRSAIPAIRRRLLDTDAEVRARAMQALVKLDGARALPFIVPLRVDTKIQRVFAYALREIPEAAAEDQLLWLLENAEPNARTEAIQALGERRSERAVAPILKSLLADEKQVYGHEEALSLIGPVAAPALLEAYPRSSNSARYGIVGALGRTRDRRALPILRACLTSTELTAQAIEALGHLGDREAVPWLRPYLDSEDDWIRSRAILALGRLRDASSFSRIVSFLARDDEANDAAMALGFLGDPRAIDPILGTLQREKIEGRWQIVDALGYFRDPRLVPFLIKELDHPDGAMGAAQALGRIGDPVALPALRKAAESDDERIKSRAEAAIAAIEKPKKS